MSGEKGDYKKIAIVAGEGLLPRQIYDACVKRGVECCVVGLLGFINPEIFYGVNYKVFSTHKINKILKYLNDLGIKHLVLAGGVRRKGMSKLFMDTKGAKLFARILRYGFSDNAALLSIIKFFEKEGFTIIPPEEIAPEIIMQRGNITDSVVINDAAMDDVRQGVKILRGIAQFDAGQSLVIQRGLILGVEASEGTDALIKRCGEIKQDISQKPILIKIAKAKQDKRVNLPYVGPRTIECMDKHGFGGIVLESNLTFVLNKAQTTYQANKKGIFIYGL